MRRIKVEDVFNVAEEIVKGINPITKEPIEFKRYVFTAGGIKFTRHEKSYIEDILNMDLSYNEYKFIRKELSNYISSSKEIDEFTEDELMIEKVLKMDESIAVRAYLINTMADILFTYLSSDMEENEIRMYINNDVEYLFFKRLCELGD